MFDAFQALIAERDRPCVVASILPDDKTWGKRKRVRITKHTDGDGQPLVFDIDGPPQTAADLARQLRRLPLVVEASSPDLESDEEAIL